jgi:hypothetical protein
MSSCPLTVSLFPNPKVFTGASRERLTATKSPTWHKVIPELKSSFWRKRPLVPFRKFPASKAKTTTVKLFVITSVNVVCMVYWHKRTLAPVKKTGLYKSCNL